MKLWRQAAAAATLFGVLGSVVQGADLDPGDVQFMQQAARAGEFEIQASRLASRRAGNGDLEQYAETMILDHTGLVRELQALAQAKGISLPDDPSRAQQQVVDTLKEETGDAFDKRYAREIAVAAHKQAVDLFGDAAGAAHDPEVKAFAQQTLPNLKRHLDRGIALNKQMQASGKASPPPDAAAAPIVTPEVSPASRQAPPSLLPGDKGAPAS